MSSTSNTVYISIESRKGGVGKTTVALTLAEMLLQKGYQILFFDMDIIGTRLDPKFIESNQLIHEVSYKDHAANLLRLFNEVYMLGKNVPAFISVEAKQSNYLTFKRDKCNYIGSDIYTGNKDSKDEREEKQTNTLLEDPRVLYDAFHAYWMIEYVKEIVHSFEKAIERDDKLAIILDNSPGFSSIENGLHDFLTDIGSDKGKFIIVSSIEPQDLEACRQTEEIINNIYKDKVAAGEYYRSLLKNGTGNKVKSPAFDSVWKSLCMSNGCFPEYYSSHNESEAKKFIGILVNKVPRNIYEQLFEKKVLHKKDEELQKDLEESAAPFLNHLLYYFNNQLFAEKEITHQINYNSGSDEYYLSGEIANIDEDGRKYERFLDYIKQIGLNILFKTEWSPITPFIDIIEYLRRQEVLIKDVSLSIISEIYNAVKDKKGLERDVEIVKRFVLEILKEENPIQEIFPHVIDFVKNAITDDGTLNLHPDSPELETFGDFVSYVGFAIYWLNNYGDFCSLLNELRNSCLEDVETMEMIDPDTISNKIDSIFKGKEKMEDIKPAISSLISNKINARELRESLKKIIKPWEL